MIQCEEDTGPPLAEKILYPWAGTTSWVVSKLKTFMHLPLPTVFATSSYELQTPPVHGVGAVLD